jgi:GNAT superfamily N-acetyltransferase
MSAASPPALRGWTVRDACREDVPWAVAGVRALLEELGGTPPPEPAMREAAQALLGRDSPAGALLVVEATSPATTPAGASFVAEAAGPAAAPADASFVAEATSPAPAPTGAIIGVLGVSWQVALHTPGPYALIQDLWVHPTWRHRAVGRQLLQALYDRARARGIARIEVGLPRESYPGLAATAAFYERNDFEPVGLRMRRSLT